MLQSIPFSFPTPHQWETFLRDEEPLLNNGRSETFNPTPMKWWVVEAINREVNRCTYTPDKVGHDEWKILKGPSDSGDCEDFALTKMYLLWTCGFPLGCMRPTICNLSRQDKKHMVLSFCTQDETYILDNVAKRIRVEERFTGYKWLGWLEGGVWHPVRHSPDPS